METKILSLDSINEDKNILFEAAQIIKNGGLVVFPTETVYGLGADATNADATKQIYHAKGRPSDNPLIIHIADPKDAENYAFTNSAYYLLAERFMPGPLTVILNSKDSIPLSTRGGLDTVAVRCPADPIANELIRLSGVPIAAPSANLSGSPSPTGIDHVINDMLGRVDMIIDGGDCDFGLESTIVRIDSEDSLTLLRPGKITVNDLSAAGFNVMLANAVTEQLRDDEKALSPGMKYKHYAPKSPLVLLDGSRDNVFKYITESKEDNIAIIAYFEDMSFYSSCFPKATVLNFGNKEDKLTQAHLLFKLLRDTDKREYKTIYAPLPEEDGIGLALYNRMIRAAAHQIIRL